MNSALGGIKLLKIGHSPMIPSSPMPLPLIIFISLISIGLVVYAQYTDSKSPKKTPSPKRNPFLSDASFIDLARSIPIGNTQVQEIWNRLLEAIQQQPYRDCDPELFLEMLGALEGRPGDSGFNEISLTTLDCDGGDPNTVGLYWIAYGKEEITCPKKELLDAFHALELALNNKPNPLL